MARYFKMSAVFWLGLQMDFDLDVEVAAASCAGATRLTFVK